MNTTSMAVVKFSVEVIMLPVSDVEGALRFYVDQVGFTLDVDYSPNGAFRVVQLTPPGSSCSIQIGKGPPTRRFTSQRLSRRSGHRGRAETMPASSISPMRMATSGCYRNRAIAMSD